ncbi:MAG TPA: TetR/AcrR family transcriptional regulator [Coleofasciculaceae cyanobacterium]|jgi:AcrR family transcriptional regulator
MSAQSTKSRIIETAIQLFNQQGTAAVSTNHIAEFLKISPGNLYYHFRNKQEIIQAILEQMIREMDGGWTPNVQPSLSHLHERLSRVFFLLWEYRFFYREQIALFQADPKLKKRYRTIHRQRLAEIEAFCQGLVETGVLRRFEDSTTLPALIKIIWLINDAWLPSLEMEDAAINPQTIQEAINLMLQVMRPYMSKTALAEWPKLTAMPAAIPTLTPERT